MSLIMPTSDFASAYFSGKTSTVMVDVSALNAAADLGTEIAGRREGVHRFLATGKAVQAPFAVLDPDGSVSFEDGRHRFAALRDLGARQVAVTVPRGQRDAFKARFGA